MTNYSSDFTPLWQYCSAFRARLSSKTIAQVFHGLLLYHYYSTTTALQAFASASSAVTLGAYMDMCNIYNIVTSFLRYFFFWWC